MTTSDGEHDRINTHLERGWALLGQRDHRRAELSARQVLELDPENPEAWTLLGLAALGEGEAEEALEAFDRAVELDPDYAAPVFYGAEALALDDERIPAALERLDRTYDLVDSDSPEFLDAVLLHAELLARTDDRAGAARKLASLRPERVPVADQQLQAGRLALRLEAADLAEAWLAPLVDHPELGLDARYGLAQVAELRGQWGRATDLYLAIRDADEEAASEVELPEDEVFLEALRLALARLQPDDRARLGAAPVRLLDVPPAELVAEGLDPWVPLVVTLYEGETTVAPGAVEEVLRIFVYRMNLHGGDPRSEGTVDALVEHLEEALDRLLGEGEETEKGE
jgi:tetratricopeptide (TPR) repeat protein